MKIALIAPIEETVPPQKYGGTEWIVYDLAHGLGKKGHEVDLYAAGNSKKEEYYNLISTVPQSIRTLPEIAHDERLRDTTKFISYAKTIEMLVEKKYDVVHNHCSWRFLLFSKLINDPILTTHHGPLSFEYQNIVYRLYKNLPYVSISNNQRKDLPELNFIQTVYNGIDLSLFPFDETLVPDKNSPMLFLARLSTEKGPITAAQVAHKINKKLIITAKVDSVDEPNYEKLKEYLDQTHVEFHGEITPDQRSRWLTTSRSLLVPIQWEEPFGLMFIEAMASGTPVITYSRGSAPEIIKDGVTGFLVNQSNEFNRGEFIIKKTGIEGLCEAVERIYALSDDEYKRMRKACREHVEKYFTVGKMVDEYEAVYKKIIGA